MDAEKVMDVIGAQMRAVPPVGVDAAYVDGFLARNRAELVAQLRAGLNQMQMILSQHEAQLQAEREQKARRSLQDDAIEAMGLRGIPGLEVYQIRKRELGVAHYGVRYMGTARGWFSHFDEPGGVLDAYASIDNGIFSNLTDTVLGQSYSYRGLMRHFAPEVYDLIAPTSRAFPASEIPFSFKTKAGVGFCALYYPGSFGIRREVVSQVQIQASPRGSLVIEYVVQGKRKPLSVIVNGNEQQFVVLMAGLEERLHYQPYASARGTILHRMYDTGSRKQFLYRLREWLRWEPVQPIWLGYGGLDMPEDYYASDWATTPLLRELEMVVEEKAPRLVSEVEPLITGAWDVSQVDRVDAAIQRAIPDSGHGMRLDVIRALMRHLV